MGLGIKRLNVNGKAKVHVKLGTREAEMITKEEQRLIVRSGGSTRAWMQVLGVVLARVSFRVSSVICIWS